jgi:hypothetical protein
MAVERLARNDSHTKSTKGGEMRGFFWLLVVCAFMAAFAEGAAAQQGLDAQIASLIDQIKNRGSLKFDPTTPQSAIDTEAYQLQRLSNAALVTAISDEGANALAAQQLAKGGNGFSNIRFAFSGQSIGATLDYKGSISVPASGQVDAAAELHAQLTPAVELATDRPTAEFKVRLAVTALDISSLSLSRNGQPLPTMENALVDVLVSGLLLPAQALLNRVEFRVPTIVAAKLDIRPTETQGIAISFDPKTVTPQLQIVAAAFLIDGGRLTIIAQDGPPTNTPSSKPANTPFDAFRNEFINALSKTGAAWIDQGDFAAYVETDVVQRLTSKLLATGPLCVQAKVVDLSVPTHDKLTLPPESSIDCTPTQDCTPTKNCDQTMDCEQRAACGDVCTLRAPFTGHCITHGHDLGCEAGKAARKLACEGQKTERKTQCETEKAATKLSCETLKESEKAGCEGIKEAYKRLRGTGPDYANIDSDDMRLNGGAKVCLSEIKLEGKALRLTGKLRAEGAASANGNVKFTPLNVVGHVLCFADFSYHVSDNVTVTPQPIDVDTNAQLQSDGNQVSINVAITNPIHIHFPFLGIAGKLAADPKFQIVCPIPGVATKLRVLTPEQWWPKVARGDIDKDFPSFNFNLDLFTKPVDAGGIALAGALQRTDSGIGGVFHVVKGTTAP